MTDDPWAAFPVAPQGADDPWAAYPVANPPQGATTADAFWNGVNQLASGATFGAANNIAAAGNATVGKIKDFMTGEQGPNWSDRYSADLASQQARDQQFQDANPASSTIERVAGAALPMVTGPLANAIETGAKIIPPLLRGPIIGGAIGGAQGAGNAQGDGTLAGEVEARGEGALRGGAEGAAVGTGVPMLAKTLSATVGPIIAKFSSSTQPAIIKLAQNLARDGLTPDQVAAKLNELGPDATIADAGGANTLGLARGVATRPGDAKDIATEVLNARQEGQGSRIAGQVGNNLSSSDVHATADSLMAQRSADAAPAYQKAMAKGAVWSPRLQEFLDDPIAKNGLKQGLEIQRIESVANGQPFSPSDSAVTGFDGEGNPQLGAVPNMRTLDATKRGLDNILEQYRDSTTGKLVLDQRGRAIDQFRQSFLKEADTLNPDYAEARAKWAGPSQSLDAMQKGRDFISSDSEVTAKQLAGLSDNDKAFFRMGAAKQLRDMIYNTPDGVNAVRRIFGTQAIRDKLQAVFPDPASYFDFARTMKSEATFFGTRNNILGNSRTPVVQAEQADLGHGVPLLMDAAQGNVHGMAHKIFGIGLQKLMGPSEKMANDLAPMMFSTDPTANANTLGLLGEAQKKALATQSAREMIARALASGVTSATAGQSRPNQN